MVGDTNTDGDLEARGPHKPEQSPSDLFRSVGLGILALAIGIAGAALPVLPGWMFGFIGLLLLGSAIPPLRRIMSGFIGRSGRVIDRCVESRRARRWIVRTLGMPTIHKALEPSARWKLLNHAARHAAQDATESASDDTAGPAAGAG